MTASKRLAACVLLSSLAAFGFVAPRPRYYDPDRDTIGTMGRAEVTTLTGIWIDGEEEISLASPAAVAIPIGPDACYDNQGDCVRKASEVCAAHGGTSRNPNKSARLSVCRHKDGTDAVCCTFGCGDGSEGTCEKAKAAVLRRLPPVATPEDE